MDAVLTRQPEQRCPICRNDLEVVSSRHGIVLVCPQCKGGATTLAVLRRVAPRAVVNRLWQAAQKHGVPSSRQCPSCNNQLLEVLPPHATIEPGVDVCIPCFFVWLGPEALSRAAIAEPKPENAKRDALLQVALEAEASSELASGDGLAVAEAVMWALVFIGGA